MKIILATPAYPPEIGGPATYTKELYERWRHVHEITIVAYAYARDSIGTEKLIPVGKHRPLIFRLAKYFWVTWRAAKKADLIYVQNAMAAGLPVALVSIIQKVPFVLKFVGDEAWERATQRRLTTKRLEEFLKRPEGGLKIKLMMSIQKFVLRRAAIVTVPALYLREQIIKTYDLDPQCVIVNYNAAEKPETLIFKASPVKHQILTTARLVAWKGIDGIIKAVSILSKKFPKVRLVVAGDGPERKNLQKIANELNIADKITFLGNISRAETWQWRKNSAVYVLNSTYEGLPHTVLTSFAARIPTVATDIAGTNEAVYHEKTGLLVRPRQPEELARAIEKLFEQPELAAKLVFGGAKLLEEKFSWRTHLETLNRIFESVLTKPLH